MDKWVPADGGNMHLGYNHTAAKYGCHSKAEVSHTVQLHRGWPPNTEKAQGEYFSKNVDIFELGSMSCKLIWHQTLAA